MMTNAIFCLHCFTIVVSFHRHDFKYCACADENKRVAVDGGRDYIRRGFGSEAMWVEADGTLCNMNKDEEGYGHGV